MPLIVQPRGGIREPERGSMPPGGEARSRLELREKELDGFYQRLVTTLSLDGEVLRRADLTVQRLAGLGMLIVPDWVATYDQLARLEWLEVWEDVQLPKPILPVPLQAIGQAQPWHLAMIKRQPGFGSSHVSIGVIDFGFSPLYPDLQNFQATHAKYVEPTPSTAGGMVLSNSPQPAPGTGDHGSMVCVMLAGKTCGVAPDAGFFVASIAAVGYGGTQSKMFAAVNWLLTVPTARHPQRSNGCDIITTSVITGSRNATVQFTPIEAALASVEAANTLMIAAVGNDNAGGMRPPGSSPKAVAVGAVDENRNVASFSGDGAPNKPDLVAPGKNIEIPDTGTGHIKIEGTSFAAPIVAGAAALILEQQPALRQNVVLFRSTVKGFTSPSTSPGSLREGSGICDLTSL